jgi:putative SbcD/Mre11-related phosphoesterase
MLLPIKNSPALLYKQKHHKTLIIADLHLGWEVGLIGRGIHVPSLMSKTRQELLSLVGKTKPDTLIILGDVKHTIARAEPREWEDVPQFFETIKMEMPDIHIIRGNHDGNLLPMLPSAIRLHPSTGITLNDVGFFHGHTWPAKRLLNCRILVMGHVHPIIAFCDPLGFKTVTRVWVKVRISARKLARAYLKGKKVRLIEKPLASMEKHFNVKPRVEQIYIMPCFNSFLGGHPLNRKATRKSSAGPILRSGAINIAKAEAYLLDGTFLGAIERLRELT